MFGSLGGQMPLRLGPGGGAETGWTAAQHARFCADLVAVGRVAPIATWFFTLDDGEATISYYSGRNGTGLAYAPTASVQNIDGIDQAVFTWTSSFPDPHDPNKQLYMVPLVASATSAAPGVITNATVSLGSPTVGFSEEGTGGQEDAPASVTVWGIVGEQRAIGDYGGDLNKEDSTTEGVAPYSEFILRQIQRDRGTAYTKEAGTLVDVENVALARFLSATGPRLAEKFRANCVPGRSDERLPYWEKVLAVPKRFGEPKWRTRQKLAAHYRLTEGPNVASLRTALQETLGDAFVDMSWDQGADLDNPPTETYWPGVNPGDDSLSLGGGAWTSSRAVLRVQVTRPPGMSVSEFQTLMDVDLFALLDRMLPATKTWTWYLTDDDGGGFFLDESLLDFTGLTDP